jgi:hypothetical protein
MYYLHFTVSHYIVHTFRSIMEVRQNNGMPWMVWYGKEARELDKRGVEGKRF